MTEIKAGAILAEAAKTYNERNAVYGDNFKRVGGVMQALFPNGVKLDSDEAFQRWHILELAVVKLTRWAVSVERGESHQDSLRDLAVYSAILEEIDTNANFFTSEGEVRGRIFPVKEKVNAAGPDQASPN
jgi:hypothetical protein